MNELGNTPADKDYKPSGISKAESRAMQAYPNMVFPFTPLDLNAYRREAFINGYEAAEKDLALTWEDIAKIDALILEANNEFAVDYSKEISREQFYTEVLKRFKETKDGNSTVHP